MDLCTLFVDWYIATFTMENHTLTNLSSLGSVLTLGIAPAIYFWKKDKDKKFERQQASSGLYLELKDTVNSLKYEGHENEFYNVDIKIPIKEKGEFIEEKEITAYFMNRDLNHDFYDSLVFSGKITFLELNLQQQIQDTFKRIKKHNEYLLITKQMGEEDETNPIPKKSFAYYNLLDKDERQLKKRFL
jgi:hypothetical protein